MRTARSADTSLDLTPLRATTVPPCLLRNSIGDRHIPTRHSLRHSRMMAMSTKMSNNIRRHRGGSTHWKIGGWLAFSQLVLGCLLIAISFWLLLWTPSLPHRDVPHWSGLLCVSGGLVGCLLLCCCNGDVADSFGAKCLVAVKLFCLSVTCGAIISCLCSAVFASIHLGFLYRMTCYMRKDPSAQFLRDEYCACQLNETAPARTFIYPDLSCTDVQDILAFLLLGSGVLNILAVIIGTTFVCYLRLYRGSSESTPPRNQQQLIHPLATSTPRRAPFFSASDPPYVDDDYGFRLVRGRSQMLTTFRSQQLNDSTNERACVTQDRVATLPRASIRANSNGTAQPSLIRRGSHRTGIRTSPHYESKLVPQSSEVPLLSDLEIGSRYVSPASNGNGRAPSPPTMEFQSNMQLLSAALAEAQRNQETALRNFVKELES